MDAYRLVHSGESSVPKSLEYSYLMQHKIMHYIPSSTVSR